MSISFERVNNEFVMSYAPAMGIDEIAKRLLSDHELNIKHTFFVTEDMLRGSNENDFEETLRFCIGEITNGYIKLDSNVFSTKHQFYFDSNINITPNMLIAYRNISILRKIDDVIDNDFYVGGEWETTGGISKEAYLELLNSFPKTAELNKYAHYRIANILKEYFPSCDKYEKVYEKFILKKNSNIINQDRPTVSKSNLAIEVAQFSVALEQLKTMILHAEGISEVDWQEKIQDILQLLYPKYIFCTREISFKGIDGYDKRPDFMLVDTNGFVDILEIKKPSVRILTKQASYRNNYVPVRDFAGAIQQIEKYIFCLTALEKSQKEVLRRLEEILPENITPEIVNPQGILLLGRSNDFNVQQKRDFELIKRQYKNIADIMTYDELIERIENIINSLKLRLSDG